MTDFATVSRVVERAARDLGLRDDDIEGAIEMVLLSLVRPARVEGLTDQQSRLVRALHAARGRIVTPETLLVVIGSDGCANAISVLLSNIEKARPDLGAVIANVWGDGYRWTGGPEEIA